MLPGFLYLGSYDNASRSELLTAMGITHILNVSRHMHTDVIQLLQISNSAANEAF